MDITFGVGFVKAAMVSQQALFGSPIKHAASLMTSLETLGGAQRFLRHQENIQAPSFERKPGLNPQQQSALHTHAKTQEQAVAFEASPLPFNTDLGRRLNTLA